MGSLYPYSNTNLPLPTPRASYPSQMPLAFPVNALSALLQPGNASLPKPKPQLAKDRPYDVKIYKMIAETVTGFVGYCGASRLGAHLCKTKVGEGASMFIGALGFLTSGALTGAVFSHVYQKKTTNMVDRKTLIKDTLWGAIGF